MGLWSLRRFEHVLEVIATSLLVFLNLHQLHVNAEKLGLWCILVLLLKRCCRWMFTLHHFIGRQVEFICTRSR